MYTLTIVVPVYNENENIILLRAKIYTILKDIEKYKFKILFVDDGSSDNSWKVITDMSISFDYVSGIRLSRNFGKEIALSAGVEYAQNSDAIICIDADLQHPPEKILELLNKWENGAEVVIGIREDCNTDSKVKQIGSKIFNTFLCRFSHLDTQPNSTDFRLLDKKVVHSLLRFSERNRMFRGLVDWMGFTRAFINFDAPARHSGSPTYSFRKLVALAVNSLTSFSLLPLRLTGYLGLVVVSFSSIILCYMPFSEYILGGVYTPLAYFMIFNTLLVGIVLCALGMIALYIGHIHTEVVNRPLFIVTKEVGGLDCKYISCNNESSLHKIDCNDKQI